MCNHERLLDYLYDELTPAGRAAFQRHLQECPECRTELAELGGTRLALALWSPPDAELGFRIVRNPVAAPRRAWASVSPAWGLAAAAAIVLAVAAAIANLEIRYDSSGFIVRTGWERGSIPATGHATAPGAAAVPVAASEEWKERLRLLDARLQQLEQRDRRVMAASTAEDGTRMSDAQLLSAMRKIIAESETRQQRELALRVTQVIRDVDASRVGDLARVEQGLRQIQGLTDAELIRHRDTLNHLLRVTQQR